MKPTTLCRRIVAAVASASITLALVIGIADFANPPVQSSSLAQQATVAVVAMR